MAAEKVYSEGSNVNATEINAEDGIPTTGAKSGTFADREAMRRLGKAQVFKVPPYCLRGHPDRLD